MKRKTSSVIKWVGKEVPKYYNSPLLSGKESSFYFSFRNIDTDFNIGDYVLVQSSKFGELKSIYQLKCFYSEEEEFKAIGTLFRFAKYYQEYFNRLNVDFDYYNEVVQHNSEEIIDLNNVILKCRIVFGAENHSVAENIEARNFNKEMYFLCRYQFNENLVSVSVGGIKSDISFDEEIEADNRTPSQKSSKFNENNFFRKKKQESIEFEDIHVPQISQVKRNLNNSFNASPVQDQNLYPEYSVVEHDFEDNLKMKLRVMPNFKDKQPYVLLNKIDIENMSHEIGNREQSMKTDEHKEARTKCRSSKTSRNDPGAPDITHMVENMNISNNTPTKRSPRKLRKLSTRIYWDFSESDSDSGNLRKRKSSRRKNSSFVEIENRTQRKSNRLQKENKVSDKENNTEQDHENDLQGRKYDRSSSNKISCDIDKDKFDDELILQQTYGSIKVAGTRGNETPKQASRLKHTPKRTPSKLIRDGTLTPSIESRKKVVVKANTPLVLARNNLHVSYIPSCLPCREKEYNDVYNFIRGKLEDKSGGCMYISGVPGTGKTATVTMAIGNLIKNWKHEGNQSFNFICVNGMRLTEPRQCYVEIVKQLSGKRLAWEQALSELESKFISKYNKKVTPTVLLVDELDVLCTKRQDVVYNLLDWPTKANAQLIVVTIANTMDLPERLLMSRVTSRLGLTRLTFQAYSHKQLQEIVVNRLVGNNSFKSDAIQFVARKVASVSGDARRALDICRRSAEIAELEGPNTLVTMKHVNQALEAMITQPKIKAICRCSRLEKLLLKSIIAEVERTGVEETFFGDVLVMLTSLAAFEGFKMVTTSSMLSAVYRLSSCRLILADQKCSDFNQRIILNVSSDDVYFALRQDEN